MEQGGSGKILIQVKKLNNFFFVVDMVGKVSSTSQYSNGGNQLLSKHRGTIRRIPLNKNKESGSLLIILRIYISSYFAGTIES
jgi:hypothetical protein